MVHNTDMLHTMFDLFDKAVAEGEIITVERNSQKVTTRHRNIDR